MAGSNDIKDGSNIEVRRYDDLDLCFITLQCDNSTLGLLSLIPHDYCADIVLFNSDPNVWQYAEEQLKRHDIDYEALHTQFSGWFGVKYKYTLFRLRANYGNLSRLSAINFSHCSDTFFSFVLSNELSISKQVVCKIFSSGDHMRTGKRWLSWFSSSIKMTKCEYIVVPEYELPYVNVLIGINKLESWWSFIKDVYFKDIRASNNVSSNQ